jgi:phosphoketolase
MTIAERSLNSAARTPNYRMVRANLTPETPMTDTLSPDLLCKMHVYWRAANYLSVGQIYLRDNPLLEESLTRGHVNPHDDDLPEVRDWRWIRRP